MALKPYGDHPDGGREVRILSVALILSKIRKAQTRDGSLVVKIAVF